MKLFSELGTSKAPWKLYNDEDVYSDEDIGVVYSYDCSYLSKADAKLISAAPDLYKMLHALYHHFELEYQDKPMKESYYEKMWLAKQALEKAGG